MDIANVGFALSTVSSYDIGTSASPVTLQESIGVAMLSKTMDLNETLNTELVQAMERSVTPNLGGNIDIYI